ncbi:hypothetical protein [Vannielia sp.]|uniref:hypothetical protein n=1 Tax=Vannielia sp. TaxID=2813045 RepID=UPI00262C4489|nr:hypothetical protein [Vannielia sp.]
MRKGIKLFGRAFGAVFSNLHLVAMLTVPFLLIMAALIYGLANWINGNVGALLGMPGAAYYAMVAAAAAVFFAAVLFLGAPHAIAWHRRVASPGTPLQLKHLVIRQNRGRYLLNVLVVALPVLAVFVVLGGGLPILFDQAFFGIQNERVFMISVWAYTLVHDYLPGFSFQVAATLFGFGFPAAALGDRLPFWRGLWAGFNRAGSMLMALLLLEGIAYFLLEVLVKRLLYWSFTSFNDPGFLWGEVIAGFIFSCFGIPITIVILTLSYLDWRAEKEPAEAASS